MRRAARTLSKLDGMNAWPPKPAWTDMTSTRSTASRSGAKPSIGTSALKTSPAQAPPARMRCKSRRGSSVASKWMEMMSAPAARKSSISRSTGFAIK